MAARVNKICLAGFRGATSPVEISFDKTKSVLLIFGENGTGKSTIADALDFICNRGFGSLEDRSLSGQPKSHLTALGQDPKTLMVNLCTSKGDIKATLTKDGPSVSPTTGCPDARILRRSNILQLLNAQPKQRFEALKSFIAVPGIEKSENALREAFRTADTGLNEAVRAYGQAKTELEKLWEAEEKPETDALHWAKIESNKDIATLQGVIESIDIIETAYQNAQTELSSLDSALSNLALARADQISAQEEQKKVEARQPKVDAPLLRILQEAKLFISSRNPTQCPVCEQGITAGLLAARLNTRIAEMSELYSALNAVLEVKRSVEGKEAIVVQARKDFLKQIGALAAALKASNLEEVSNLNISWHDFHEVLIPTQNAEVLEQKARRFWDKVLPCRKSLDEHRAADQKSINQRNAIKGHLDAHAEKFEAAKELEIFSKKLEKALEIVSKQRKDYVEGILAAISNEVELLYTTLHPGEGIGKVRFYLKPRAIGSLEFDGHFQGVPEIPPQAYYSESHLDTLGICVFLALAKHFKTENTILVLDDVVTSVDGLHLDRFMSLIHAEAAYFNQVIITTHYRPWRDRYRWAKGPAAKTQVIELGPWNLQNGLQTGDFVTAVGELKVALKKPAIDRQAVASKAGIVLESLLDFITLKYRCSVPRNARNEYTLGDLAGGIDSKLAKVLCCRKPSDSEKSEATLKPLIDAATGVQWIRNCVGCHFHATGSEISNVDIQSFAQSVVALAETMICKSCGALPTRRPSGSHWQCICGELELHPLVYPGADLRTVADET